MATSISSISSHSILHSFEAPGTDQVEIRSLFIEAILFSACSLPLIAVFEFLISPKSDIQRLWDRKGGEELHKAALCRTAFNHLVLGPLTYIITIYFFCHSGPLTLFQQMRSIVKFLLIEGILYYAIHRAFHEVSGLYWVHRFHHKFNAVVLPSSASAVSTIEFAIAYMFPLSMGAWFGSCDKFSALSATIIVELSNLCIHTPALEEKLSFLPWMFVTPADHLRHHRQVQCDYSAPVFHFDRITRAMRALLFVEDGAEKVK